MLKQIDLRGKGPNWRDLLPVSSEIDELPIDSVREIISQVRDSGDTALRDLTQKFDGVTLDELTVNEKDLEDAYNSISKEFKKRLMPLQMPLSATRRLNCLNTQCWKITAYVLKPFKSQLPVLGVMCRVGWHRIRPLC